MSEKPTRKATDYAVESREARNRSVFRPQMKIGSRKTLRSYTIQADRCRKRRFQYKRILLGPGRRALYCWRHGYGALVRMPHSSLRAR